MRVIKKTAAVIAVITAAVILFCVRASAAEPVCSLSADGDIKQGKAFGIRLTIDNGAPLGAAEAELGYDSSLLRFDRAELIDKDSNDVFGCFDSGDTVRVVLSLYGTSRSAVTVMLRFSPLSSGTADYGFSVASCTVTDNGTELCSPASLPRLSVEAADDNAGQSSEKKEQSSKEQSRTSSKTSSQKSKASSEQKTSKQSSAKSGSAVSETAGDGSEEGAPSANTFYIQRDHEPSDPGQVVFLAAAGTAVIVVLMAVIFFWLGRRSSVKKDDDSGKK